MEAIQKSLSQKILSLMKDKILPITPRPLSAELGIAECRILACLKELMSMEKVQLAGGGGWCVKGWEGRELSDAESKRRATLDVDMNHSIQGLRQMLRDTVVLCDKELIHYRDCDIKVRTGIKQKALKTIKDNRRP